MKNLLVFAALAFGVATSHQALACDRMHEANQGRPLLLRVRTASVRPNPSRLPSKSQLKQRRLCLKLTLSAPI
jgi:hypothetical protein